VKKSSELYIEELKGWIVRLQRQIADLKEERVVEISTEKYIDKLRDYIVSYSNENAHLKERVKWLETELESVGRELYLYKMGLK
jgi:predicted RNase H-like nuclease (RuvC/YqgF family)